MIFASLTWMSRSLQGPVWGVDRSSHLPNEDSREGTRGDDPTSFPELSSPSNWSPDPTWPLILMVISTISTAITSNNPTPTPKAAGRSVKSLRSVLFLSWSSAASSILVALPLWGDPLFADDPVCPGFRTSASDGPTVE